ncbi:MAG: hypothetical protein HYV09_29660 [Deltaproteobacteria bacterium]|nr:hypothetical protein [Deltaproteobacteria bacterium]
MTTPTSAAPSAQPDRTRASGSTLAGETRTAHAPSDAADAPAIARHATVAAAAARSDPGAPNRRRAHSEARAEPTPTLAPPSAVAARRRRSSPNAPPKRSVTAPMTMVTSAATTNADPLPCAPACAPPARVSTTAATPAIAARPRTMTNAATAREDTPSSTQ